MAIFIFSIIKNKTKKNIISSALKFIFIALILFIFAWPSIQYYKNKKTYKKLFLFIDYSLSMNDAHLQKKYISAKNKAEKLITTIKKYSPLPLKTFYTTSNAFPQKTIVNPYSKFNTENVLIESKNNEAQIAFIITDFTNLKIPEKINTGIPVYFIKQEALNTEVFIKSCIYINPKFETIIINNGKPQTSYVNIYTNKVKIYTKKIFLKNGLNTITGNLTPTQIKSKVLKVTLTGAKTDKNVLNNVFYFKAEKKKKLNIYTFFSRPSYDTKFLMRFLKTTDKFSVKTIIPGADKSVNIAPSDKYNAAFAGDLWPGNILSTKGIVSYVKNGGTLIYLHKNSNLGHVVFKPLKTVLPFTLKPQGYSPKQREQLTPTAYGLNFSFINFRDKDRAREIWKSFMEIKPIEEDVIPKRGAKTLLKYGNKPVFLRYKLGKGVVYAILFQPLWKMDFTGLGYGTKTYFLNILYNDLITSSVKTGKNPVVIPNPVIKSGEKVKIIANTGYENALASGKLKIYLQNKTKVKRIYFKRVADQVISQIKISRPGKYDVLLNGKNIGRVYVNYPESELAADSQKNVFNVFRNQTNNVKILHEKDLIKTLKSFNKVSVSKRVQKSVDLNALIILSLIILCVILAAWYFRPE